MDVTITTFTNPFSFHCMAENGGEVVNMLQDTGSAEYAQARALTSKSNVWDFDHGHYVAVMWKDKWVRGVVNRESEYLIWLVDYGVYVRANDKTVFINLPDIYKKYPTKVFEASIHGVAPLDKVFTDECLIENRVTTEWNKAAIEKAQTLIANAVRRYFIPIAILSTKHNDIVLGDLYLRLFDKGMVNIIDELQLWPLYLERNPRAYIENLPVHYRSRRKHRANLLKPDFPDMKIPTITLEISLAEYESICSKVVQPCELLQFDSDSEGGSTVTKTNRDLVGDYKLSPEEIEKYSRMYVTVHDQEYNVLNVLVNKLKDLRMCEKYRDHDLKRVGRACSRNRAVNEYDLTD